jgi:hypothetical protein
VVGLEAAGVVGVDDAGHAFAFGTPWVQDSAAARAAAQDIGRLAGLTAKRAVLGWA